MVTVKILLESPHTDVVGDDVELCANYKLTTAVESVETGEVGFVPPEHYTREDVLEELKRMAVDEINSLQSTLTFDVGDVIAWAV